MIIKEDVRKMKEKCEGRKAMTDAKGNDNVLPILYISKHYDTV
jgi:hypothetical protein